MKILDDPIMGKGYWAFPSICVAIFLLFVTCAVAQSYQHEKLLKQLGCTLESQVPTGAMVYCGKACFRKEYRYAYKCNEGWRVEVH